MSYRNLYFNNNYESENGWYKCIKCGKSFRKGDMDIDHIIPKKYGGSDLEINLQCICKHCNRSKQASLRDTPNDLLRSIGRIGKRRHSEKRAMRELINGKDDDL